MTAGAAPSPEAAAIVLRHGANATSWQLLDPELSRFCAGEAVVGYLVQGRRWIAAGGPAAPPDGVADAMHAFERAAAAAGARALWFLAEDPQRAALPSLRCRWIAAQPVFAPSELLVEFARHKSLKKQLHRARNHGVAVVEAHEDAADGAALAQCLREWLRTRRAPPLRLLAGPAYVPELRHRRLFVARRDGRVVGYLLAAPIPARSGWLVEQIVRGAGACNGTAESLLHAAASAVAAEGAAMLTLGCSPLSVRSGTQPPGDARWQRSLAAVRSLGRAVYDFDGVDSFKAKFRCARWEPLWLAANGRLPDRGDLLALARACAGGSLARFLLRSLLRRLRRTAAP